MLQQPIDVGLRIADNVFVGDNVFAYSFSQAFRVLVQIGGVSSNFLVSDVSTGISFLESESLLMLYGDTRSDPVRALARQQLLDIHGVERVRAHPEGDTLVFSVSGNNLTIDDIDAIVDVKWDLIELFPGRLIDVQICDRFDS